MSRDRLYILVLAACLGGYSWLFVSRLNVTDGFMPHTEACLIKYTTGVPCPSCGSTGSVLSLMGGDIPQAITSNPIGIIVAGIMVVAPLWILIDLIGRGNSFYRFFISSERWLKKRWVVVPAILLVIANWIWNLYKYL